IHSQSSIARVRCPIRMAPRAGKAERRDMAATKTDDDSAPTQDRVIARLLTDDIVEWRIPPGSWLREREIAARFGVSHAPVREAFRPTGRIGLAQVRPWRGHYEIGRAHV